MVSIDSKKQNNSTELKWRREGGREGGREGREGGRN